MIQFKFMKKRIGTLIPMSALGTFADGLVFLDWLHKTNQSAWQLLPLYQTQLEPGSKTKHIPSPYKSYGIGLDPKYLSESFKTIHPTESEKNDFLKDNNEWIHDYALFCSLRDYFKTDDWRTWNKDIRTRNPKALSVWRKKLAKEIDNHLLMQWRLHASYSELKNKAKKLGIFLNGDLPYYVSLQSPLVWAHQKVFDIHKDGTMRYVSGVPNVPVSFFGRQVWGHPLYNWESKENWENILSFWRIRLRYFSRLFDVIRLDYAKAFYNYGVMDLENKLHDGYRKGPGFMIFEKITKFCKECGLSIFAEDSGNKMEEMRESLKVLKIPGIKILRFALDEKKDQVLNQYADIANYPVNVVAYTTTHDTETLLGYLHKLKSKQKQRLAIAANVAYDPNDKTFAKTLRDAVIASPAQTVIIPIQDWLLTTDRINIPGTEVPVNDPNWQFTLNIPIEDLPTRF